MSSRFLSSWRVSSESEPWNLLLRVAVQQDKSRYLNRKSRDSFTWFHMMVFLSHICGREVIKIFFITHGWCRTVISGLFNDLTIFSGLLKSFVLYYKCIACAEGKLVNEVYIKACLRITCSIFGWTFFTPQTRNTNSLFKKMGNSTFCKATLREEERWFFLHVPLRNKATQFL